MPATDNVTPDGPKPDQTLPIFSVVAMIRESPEILQLFYEYYISQGASHVTVYFDGECPIAQADLPVQVEILPVTDADRALIPSGEVRNRAGLQGILFKREHDRRLAQWLVAVDADELIYTQNRLDRFLADVPGDVEAVQFPTGEAVYIGDEAADEIFSSTHFRMVPGRWLSQVLMHTIYRDVKKQFRRSMVGHVSGKQALRTSARVDAINCHFATRNGQRIDVAASQAGDSQAFVAHYDAISINRWFEKHDARLSGAVKSGGKQRMAQLDALVDARRNGTQTALFDKLYRLTRVQEQVLRAAGLLRTSKVADRVSAIKAAMARQKPDRDD